MLAVLRILAALRSPPPYIETRPSRPVDPGDEWRGKALYDTWRDSLLFPWLALPWRWLGDADRRAFIEQARSRGA